MADPSKSDGGVTILPPDQTLQQKLSGANLDQLFSSQAIARAQQVITDSADTLFEESRADVQKLEQSVKTLGSASEVEGHEIIRHIVATTFSLKAKAGMGGYDLVSRVAESLYKISKKAAEASERLNPLIVKWHVDSLTQLLALQVKGLGGAVGEQILKELTKLDQAAL